MARYALVAGRCVQQEDGGVARAVLAFPPAPDPVGGYNSFLTPHNYAPQGTDYLGVEVYTINSGTGVWKDQWLFFPVCQAPTMPPLEQMLFYVGMVVCMALGVMVGRLR